MVEARPLAAPRHGAVVGKVLCVGYLWLRGGATGDALLTKAAGYDDGSLMRIAMRSG